MPLVKRFWGRCENQGDHQLCDERIIQDAPPPEFLGQDEAAFLGGWVRAEKICSECPSFIKRLDG